MIINNKKIDKLIGPVNIHILKPNNNNFPILILLSDLHYFPSDIKNLELKENDYKVYDDKFLSLLNNSKYKIDIFLEQGDIINLKEQKIKNNKDESDYLIPQMLNNINCFNKEFKKDNCDYNKINWHYADNRVLYKNEYYYNDIYIINSIYVILNIINKIFEPDPTFQILFTNELFLYNKFINDITKNYIKDQLLNSSYVMITHIFKTYNVESMYNMIDTLIEYDNILSKQLKDNKIINLKENYINFITKELFNDKPTDFFHKNYDDIQNFDIFLKENIYYISLFLLSKSKSKNIKKKYEMLKIKLMKKLKKFIKEDNKLKELFLKYLYEIILCIENLLYKIFDLYNIARIHKYNNDSNICILIAGYLHIDNINNFLINNNLYELKFKCHNNTDEFETILNINKDINIDKMINELK